MAAGTVTDGEIAACIVAAEGTDLLRRQISGLARRSGGVGSGGFGYGGGGSVVSWHQPALFQQEPATQ